jgi:hypothetical protein
MQSKYINSSQYAEVGAKLVTVGLQVTGANFSMSMKKLVWA